jgi:hypothetical protein
VRRVLALVTLALCLGLHWGVLQSVAWTTLLVGFAQDRDLDEAIGMTFDGEHPCALCCAISEARDDRQDAPAPVPAPARQELPKAIVPNCSMILPGPLSSLRRYRMTGSSLSIGRELEPPTPPPRRA